MASSTLSSPSQQLLSSFGQATTQRPATPVSNGGAHSQNKHHTSPYALRQRSANAAASWRGDNDDRQRDELLETVERDEDGEGENKNDTCGGRRELESDSSVYEPSGASSSSPEAAVQEAKEDDKHSVQTDNGDEDSESGSSEGDSSSSSSEEDDNSTAAYRSSLKRPHQRTLSTSSADVEASPPRGRKKRLRKSINMPYMGLLHDDVDDMRRQYVPDSWPELKTTQAGLSIWTTEEKEMFYEAVSRLGRDDIPGIASRLLGSKSEMEVRHYLHLLQTDAERRRFELRAPLHRPLLSDFPAATEISEACCEALEKTAGVIAQREDHQEAREEGKKWGPHWLVAGENCKDLCKAALEVAGMPTDEEASNQSPLPDGGPRGERLVKIGAQLRPDAVPPLALFQVRNMLLLSERVFMNGVDEDAHYLGMGDALPAVHMSALHDMYELVYALTQRVAATAMHICQFRYQSDRRLAGKTKRLVRSRDVQAAVASLGLKSSPQTFWARCPRRLGLKVSRSALPFADVEGASRVEVASETVEEKCSSGSEDSESDDESGNGGGDYDDDDDDDIMTYDEIEQDLLPENTEVVAATRQIRQRPLEAMDGLQDSSYDDEDSSDETDSDNSDDGGTNSTSEADPTAALTRQRIHDEANEIIRYSATGYPQASWARTSLKKRIRNELKEEEFACAVDGRASRQDELYLWSVVGQEPPPSLVAAASSVDESVPPHVEGFSIAARRYPVDEVIETGRNWRGKLQYEAEWEATAAEAQIAVRVANEHAQELS
ncbi:hypothetical protein SCUCBS95973_006424 [Sporothrix curviconia]|uniref:Myb-like domain-containing protein n=1 Tax=Sporothrix curviconia TaxID=1260050 RepID=A0ABP0C7A3_9PEZI